MNDWKYFFDCVLNYYELNNPEQVNYRIFAPDSKAEILYWFSQDDIPKQQKEAFIRALVNFDDNCGGFYRYRAYLLAAEALSYFPESSLGDAIVEQLLKWSYLYFGWEIFPQALVKAARKALEVTDKQRVITAFESLLRNTPSRFTLQSAAVKLGELDPGNKMAIAALILLLDLTQHNYRGSSICRSIGKIGVGNQGAINAVIDLMETTEDKNLCHTAIKTLGKIARGNQTATLALEKFLQINRGDRICLDAAKSLLLIDEGNIVAKDALVYLLESTALIGSNCLLFIGNVAALLLQVKLDIQEDFIAILKNQAKTGWYTYLVYGIDSTLNDFDCITETVITTLISIVENTLDKYACVNSINILQRLYSSKSISTEMQNLVTDSLERFLQKNRGDDICLDAAETLCKINPDNQIAISNLVEILEINRSFTIHEKASYILLQTDEHYEKAILALHEDEINCLNQEYEYYIPTYCIKALISNEKNLKKIAVKILLQKTIVREVSYLKIEEESKENNDCYNFDDSSLLYVADRLIEIIQKEHLSQLITALKEYLSERFYKSSSYRYDAVYKLIWHCAENMSYQDFYKAWNK